MRRLKDERGAVTVLVTLMLPVLLGMAAIAVDVSRAYQERRELQNGVDAAALAIAENCARAQMGTISLVSTCASATLPPVAGTPVAGSAQYYASKNAAAGHTPTATVDLPFVGTAAREVTVRSSRTVNYVFGPVLEAFDGQFDSKNVTAAAKAIWGPPLTLKARPIAMNRSLYTGPGTSVTINIDSTAPGARGWLRSNGDCWATTSAGATPEVGEVLDESNEPGNSVPSSGSLGCDPTDFQGKISFPVYEEQPGGSGSSVSYLIVGFATIQVSAFKFTGDPSTWCWPSTNPSCGGSDRYVKGTFVQYVAVGSPVATSGTSFGTTAIQLVNVTD